MLLAFIKCKGILYSLVVAFHTENNSTELNCWTEFHSLQKSSRVTFIILFDFYYIFHLLLFDLFRRNSLRILIIKYDEDVCPQRTQTLCSSLEAFHVLCLCFLFEDRNTQEIVLSCGWTVCCRVWEARPKDLALRRYLISRKDNSLHETLHNISFLAIYSRH